MSINLLGNVDSVIELVVRCRVPEIFVKHYFKFVGIPYTLTHIFSNRT